MSLLEAFLDDSTTLKQDWLLSVFLGKRSNNTGSDLASNARIKLIKPEFNLQESLQDISKNVAH